MYKMYNIPLLVIQYSVNLITIEEKYYTLLSRVDLMEASVI